MNGSNWETELNSKTTTQFSFLNRVRGQMEAIEKLRQNINKYGLVLILESGARPEMEINEKWRRNIKDGLVLILESGVRPEMETIEKLS